MDASQLRSSFTAFFTERGHTAVPSASLIPHHPRAPLFTNAGMNQFIPYFLGEETPPYRRATSIQKCVRIRGKHDDIDMVGRTTRHLSFFEMLGNFSFGDYFKESAIPWAWELLTGDLGLDGERLWVTVFTDDDEAAQIWRDVVGVPAERIQRMGEDNFWEMGETGPCGPCSEIYYDRGADFGAAGGPADGGDERYVEIWNLVFTQYDRQADGTLEPLPRPEHRHRGRVRAAAHDPGGRAVDLGDRRAPPVHRPGRGALRAHLRRRRRGGRHPAGAGRPRPQDRLPHRRRRPALQRRPGLRAAAPHPPRGAGGPAPGDRGAAHAGAGRGGGRGHGRRLPGARRRALGDPVRPRPRGGRVRPDAAHRPRPPGRGPRRGPGREGRRPWAATSRSGCTTPTGSRSS